MKQTLLLTLTLALSLSAAAQSERYGTEKDMPLFYQQLKKQLTYPWSWQNKRHTMTFDQWREEARRQVAATMQQAPPAPETYDYEVVAREKREGYEAQKILFNINAWEKVMAYLLVPDTRKAPALLMLHDHGAHFSIGKEKMVRPFEVDSTLLADADDWAQRCYDGIYVGDELAKAGYVVLSIDALFWGDRGRKEGVRYDSQQALAANMLQMGTSWGAWITWDDMRAAQFLAHLPMVDKGRVGCLGFSMGSYRSWMLAAMSDEVKAAAAICWMNDTENLMTLTNNQNKGGSAYSMLIPGIRNLMDYPHVASLACPKPMLFYNGDKDKLFPVPGVQNAYREMREVWHEQGADNKLITRIWQEKHFFNRAMQEEVKLFFNKHL
ncbi:MAG: alpha/beta hydrolase family protein [Prevotella sp.]|nr:alpha/beta hydrolase family protein [Prevotella sp.]